ncbi:MAG: GHKL domain-containing protein [Lachnospiraceae bacterium]
MLNLLEMAANTSIYTACSFLILSGLKSFLVPRRPRPAANILIILVLMQAVAAVVYPEELTGLTACLILLSAVFFLFFKGKWYLKLSASVILFPIIAATSYITQDAGSLVWDYIFGRNMNPYAETLLHSFTLFLRIPVYYLICRCLKNWLSDTVHILTPKMWFITDLVSLSSFTGIISVIYICPTEQSYLAYPLCATCLMTSISCFYLCTYMARAVRADMELEMLAYRKSYYEEIENNQQTVRKLRHDMKNHLNIIGMLIKDKKTSEANHYLEELNQEFAVAVRAYCPNDIVNAVLSSKEQAAAAAGISCEFQIDFAEAPEMEDIDLCSLLSNTLDNAIEACKRISQASERFLNVKARCQNGFFSYKVVNAKVNEVVEENGNFITSKKDAGSHGIGLKNVKQIIAKYDGYIEITHDELSFTLVVMIQTGSSKL